MIVFFENQLQYVMNVYHHTPGNLRAVSNQMRNLRAGTRRRSASGPATSSTSSTFEQVDMEYLLPGRRVVRLHEPGDVRAGLAAQDAAGRDSQWLKENTVCKVEFYEGSAIAVAVPFTVELKVVETEPSLERRDDHERLQAPSSRRGRPCSPPFIEIGEVIRVDTPRSEVPRAREQ